MSLNNYEDIKEGEKKQINKTVREIDGVKYIEYTYITKLKGGKIHKQIVKTKYTNKKKERPNNYDLQQTNPDNKEIKQENIKKFITEYKNQMIISLQNLIKIQFGEDITIDELNKMYMSLFFIFLLFFKLYFDILIIYK